MIALWLVPVAGVINLAWLVYEIVQQERRIVE